MTSKGTTVFPKGFMIKASDYLKYIRNENGEEGPEFPFTVEVMKAHLDVLVPRNE